YITATCRSLFSLLCARVHRDLHSFPTRRSSDLGGRRAARGARGAPCRGRARGRGRSRPEGRPPPLRRRGRSLPRRRAQVRTAAQDRKSTRLNSSHVKISYAVFCLKKKKKNNRDK